jgi:hypothetical protein
MISLILYEYRTHFLKIKKQENRLLFKCNYVKINVLRTEL